MASALSFQTPLCRLGKIFIAVIYGDFQDYLSGSLKYIQKNLVSKLITAFSTKTVRIKQIKAINCALHPFIASFLARDENIRLDMKKMKEQVGITQENVKLTIIMLKQICF